jgi:Leucine-rich repeat (LRR) protein
MYNPAIKVEDGRIVYLKLMQGCFDSIPRPVNELSMLRTLDVSNSRITRIINIGNLRRLENFYAAKTDLADVLELMEHFPLKQLDLSSNYCLKDVGALLSNTRLEKISVQFTKINTLKPFTMKVNLKELRVYQTDINWKDPKEIKFMSELKMMGTHIVDDRAYYRGER